MIPRHPSVLLQLHEAFSNLSIGAILDMAFVSGVIYLVLLWFKRTKAVLVAKGIMILAVLYFIARQLGMVLTTWIFHGFFAIFLIALVVIFQEELRHAFERLAVWRWRRLRIPLTQPAYIEDVFRSVLLLAREHIGALIVFRGSDPLDRHLAGGHELDGKISSPLLESIFDPHSDGHDGAVVIEGNRITRFAVHLPLSKDVDQLAGHGTRHAAALGLAERCDALSLVVSEQKGTIAIAQNEELREIPDRMELERLVTGFLRSRTVSPERKGWKDALVQHLYEKIFAVAFAVTLWLVFVRGVRPLHTILKMDLQNVGASSR